MMTRAERSARNKAAHALRRELVNADYRQAKADGLDVSWRQIAAQYDAMCTATVLASFTQVVPEPVTVPDELVTTSRRKAPVHIRETSETYRLARDAWENGLAAAIAGGRSTSEGGRPARGERFTDEERDYRDSHPAPLFRDFLAAKYADMESAQNA